MGEIKFRCFSKSDKKMYPVKGFEFYNMEAQALYSLNYVDGDALVQVLNNLDDFELMQYVGLKDKNGKEIYDGDVLQFKNDGLVVEVLYSNEQARWKIKAVDNQNFYSDTLTARKTKDWEIISNIYEYTNLI